MTSPPPVRLLSLFLIFLKIGAFSFGGGLSGWVHREIVQQRQWLSEADFLAGLAITQILPGANVTNLTVYVGSRLRGNVGAVVCMFGLLVVPFFVGIGALSAYDLISDNVWVRAATDGVTAAAIGILLLMAWRSGLNSARSVQGVATLAATFLAVGILKWQLLLVFICIAPLSIAAAWLRGRKTNAG
jgi:chromate transporter